MRFILVSILIYYPIIKIIKEMPLYIRFQIISLWSIKYINVSWFQFSYFRKTSLNLPIQWFGPLNKNSTNDQQAKEMSTQFNVSYNHGGENKILTIKKTFDFIFLGNNQSLLISEILSIVSVKIPFFLAWRHFVWWTDVRPPPGQ